MKLEKKLQKNLKNAETEHQFKQILLTLTIIIKNF